VVNSMQAGCPTRVMPRFSGFGVCHWALAMMIGMSAWLHAIPLHAQARGYVAVEYARIENSDTAAVIRNINSASEVAGGFKTNSRKGSSAQIFLANGLENLVGDQSADYSVAYGINDQGEIAGAFNTKAALRPFRAVRKVGFQELALPTGSNGGIAYAINELGESAGYASGSAGIRAVWWTRSGVVQLLQNIGSLTARALDLNDKGDVVGVSGDERKVAVLWPGKGGIVSLGTLPGFTHSEAVSIGENGAIAGVATGVAEFPYRSRAVLWQPGGLSIQDLGALPGGDDSRARDVNARGEVVGTSTSTDGNRAFIWTAASGMLDLNTLVAVPGLVMTDALSINKKGDIVVIGHDVHPVVPGAADEHHDHEEPRRIVVLHPLP
jgi:probable HAF family extracellular repeat protein